MILIGIAKYQAENWLNIWLKLKTALSLEPCHNSENCHMVILLLFLKTSRTLLSEYVFKSGVSQQSKKLLDVKPVTFQVEHPVHNISLW